MRLGGKFNKKVVKQEFANKNLMKAVKTDVDKKTGLFAKQDWRYRKRIVAGRIGDVFGCCYLETFFEKIWRNEK